MYSFELGPIRPPSEATSMLIRLTRNCPWNRCVFCKAYENAKFSPRSLSEIKKDIDSIKAIKDILLNKSIEMKLDGQLTESVVRSAIKDYRLDPYYVQNVAYWMMHGINNVFLQDADSFVIKTNVLVEVLKHLKNTFPEIKRITTYGRSKSISKKNNDELIEIKNAGLNRVHIGLESGSDKILEIIKKGVTSKEQIDAGKKIKSTGMELSEYYIPGIGGNELSNENAIQTARVINEINPNFIRLRSINVYPDTELYSMMIENKWAPATEIEKVKEIKLFIENLENIESVLVSDHVNNLLENIKGEFPDDKVNLLSLIDDFLSMDPDKKESFIVGKRMGMFRFLSDYRHNPYVERIKNQLKEEYGSIDKGVAIMIQNIL